MSNYHPVTIVKETYIQNLDLLASHPNIQYVRKLPYEYTLFMFYDDIFDLVYSQELNVKHNALNDPFIKEKVRSLNKEQEELLKPLYSDPKSRDRYGNRYGCIACFFKLLDKTYTLKEPGNPKTIQIFTQPINISTNKVKLHIKTKKQGKKIKEACEKITGDWRDWLINSCGGDVSIQTNFESTKDLVVDIEFNNEFEDQLAALLAMHYEIHKQTTVYWIGIYSTE